jgi:isoleucyl-tRNA synthetase
MRKSCQTVLWETLDNLTRIIAPILPFTSEETWQHFKPERLSIHLEDFPHLKKEFVLDDETLREWEILLEARTLAMAEIERKRKEGIIGNSLEAKIEIIADPKTFHLLKRHFDFLKLFFIVSSVTTKRNEKGLKINVERARGEKCVRCWNYDESVGKNTSHPQLCKRCLLIIETAPSSGST